MDIDDLLEDSEPTGQPANKGKPTTSWSNIAKTKLSGVADDEDPFDDNDLFNWGAKKKPTTAPSPSLQQAKPKEKADEDEWGVPASTTQVRSQNVSF